MKLKYSTSYFKQVSIALLLILLFTPLGVIAETDSNGKICADVITYGKNPETGEWQAFPTPCDVPTDWESSPIKPPTCLNETTYGQSPQTNNWYVFSTPCDVPDGWISSTTKPETDCPDEILHGQNPQTKNWYVFSTPCDIPNGWISSKTKPETDCPDEILYGQNPQTNNWYAFSTRCDVPTGWITSTEPPNNSLETCSDFYATYSQEGKLHIPVVLYSLSDGTIVTYEKVNMEYIPKFIEPLVFILSDVPIEKVDD